MSELFTLAEIMISLTRKSVKNVHLTVHPPEGRVSLVAPISTRMEVARAYAISKLGWIREQQAALRGQARESPRRLVERESLQLWGRRHLLTVNEAEVKPFVQVDHRRIFLTVRPGSDAAKRTDVMHAWHKALLHEVVPAWIARWEPRLGVHVSGYFLQRMKTRWGSCNHRTGSIRLNTELVKKPKDLVEYVVVHEMLHLLEPTHNDRFVALLDRHWPHWRESRRELNALPLGDHPASKAACSHAM